jgi:hypothetical protein
VQRPANAGLASVVTHLPLGSLDQAPTVAGLLTEQFTKVLPSPRTTIGLAFHCD